MVTSSFDEMSMDKLGNRVVERVRELPMEERRYNGTHMDTDSHTELG